MRRYESTDYPELKKWFEGRDMACPPENYLPRIGYIEEGLAAGFLVQTDTKMSCLDFFISNKESNPKYRDQAIRNIAERIVNDSEDLGYRFVKINTALEVSAYYALSIGFEEVGMYRTFIKEINHG